MKILISVWKLRSVLFTIPAIAIFTVAMGTLSMVASLFDSSGFTQHNMARFWSRVLLALGFVRCRVVGLEKLDLTRNYVFVSNHASFMDTPAILSSIPHQFRFFAKKGLFGIPFLGWHLRHAGHIPVIRDDPRASLKSMTEGARLVALGQISLLLFPEGGRAENEMRPFKEGAAYIAIKSGVAAVPIGLVGTREVLPMHTIVIRPGNIELRIGDPIETKDMTSREREKLNAMLRERVIELVSAK